MTGGVRFFALSVSAIRSSSSRYVRRGRSSKPESRVVLGTKMVTWEVIEKMHREEMQMMFSSILRSLHNSIHRAVPEFNNLILSSYTSSRSLSTGPWRPATEIFYEETLKKKKFNSRVRNAIRAAFENDGNLKHLFTKVLGFEICNIRVSLNKRTIFVQWDSFPERKQETFAALVQKKGVGKHLGARVTPRLEFRHDSFNAGQLELESAFLELEQKQDEERLQTALGRKRVRPNPHKST